MPTRTDPEPVDRPAVRRALLRGLAAVAGTSLLPAGGALAAVAPAARPTGAVLRRAISEPATLDPLRYGSASDFAILSDLFTGLTAFGPDGTVVPGCAARWRTREDGLQWTFELRAGLTWSDGRPLTAQDFAWAARRYLDPAHPGLLAFRLKALRNAAAIAAGQAAPSSLGLRAPDPRTVQVDLDYPQIDLPTLLAVLLPAPRHRIEALGEAWSRPANWVSNGPFLLQGRVVGDRIVLARNPRFHDAASVRLERVELVVAEAAAAFPRYRAGEIDVTRVSPEAVAWARREAPAQLRTAPARSATFVLFNTRRAPFDDARVRRALSLAVDREALARQVRGGDAEPAWSFVAPTTGDYQPTRGPAWRDWPRARRLEAARALLAAAGFGAARPLALRLDFVAGALEKREAVALAAMWREAGVAATLRSSDPRTLYGNVERGEFELASTAIAPMLPGPMIWFEVLATETARRNGGWSDARFDALVDAARRARSVAERTALLQQAEAIVLEQQPLAPLVFPAWQELVAPRVTAFPDNPTSIRPSRWLAVAG
ncbi:MAG: peptide ABC transporter substrate-binding protein [Steroidobacteraceae bacterium]|nr:peptide ABC transporter substrate-binding protein [Steroidobacteraceae bacterium]